MHAHVPVRAIGWSVASVVGLDMIGQSNATRSSHNVSEISSKIAIFPCPFLPNYELVKPHSEAFSSTNGVSLDRRTPHTTDFESLHNGQQTVVDCLIKGCLLLC